MIPKVWVCVAAFWLKMTTKHRDIFRMGYALTLAVYDFTPIHSRLWQSVAMAVGYPACGTANTCLFTSPL